MRPFANAIVFAPQITLLLNEPGADFTGSEFVLVEQRPRARTNTNRH